MRYHSTQDVLDRIASARKRQKLTQEECALDVGLRQSQWSMWETGRKTASFPTLMKMAEAVGLTLSFDLRKKS